MVQGIAARKKTYVCVAAVHDEEGNVTPKAVYWRDGRTLTIDSVLGRVCAASRKVGGTGIRYRVLICGKERVLYYENPRWFVEEIIPEDSVELLPYGNAYGKAN